MFRAITGSLLAKQHFLKTLKSTSMQEGTGDMIQSCLVEAS